MNQAQELIDIESIKLLKAKYFRNIDTKDWASLADCFTEDLVADFSEAMGKLQHGRDNFIEKLSEALEDAVSIHQGNMPEIDMLDAENAVGVWAMEDIVMLPGLNIQGWGHYHEKYRKVEGVWKIATIKLTRVRVLHNGVEIDLVQH